ncbi:dicarboxylate/amino acid:cation symporter, partial [Desulfoluna sp.]|uniref:dicarboxylate/amino acid:cation symporter n=1 Tax=Desulfoluna sp. TaxID=2045199 RepID=UPI00262A555C
VILAVYIGAIIHVLFVYGSGVALVARLSPIKFFKGIVDAQAVAFTTTSSSGTLPVTIRCTQENLGVSKSVSSFVLPMGATVNMDGTAIYQGVAALFVAQASGIDLTFANYVTLILASTLASIGTAGVPGAGLIMLSVTLSSIGLPMEGIALIAGIDRILDMARTSVNVTGDAMTSLLVAKSEGEFDREIFEATEAV